MKEYTNKELIYGIFEHQMMGTIPKFLIGNAYVMAHCGVEPSKYQKDAETFVDVNIAFKNQYDLSINYAGGFMDIPSQLGKGLFILVVTGMTDLTS